MLRYFFRKDKSPSLDDQIHAILEEMQTIGVNSSDYPMMMAYLERLSEIKAKTRRIPLNKDTVALILGNLMGILVIVAYEQKHVMTSKGFTQIIRPKAAI